MSKYDSLQAAWAANPGNSHKTFAAAAAAVKMDLSSGTFFIPTDAVSSAGGIQYKFICLQRFCPIHSNLAFPR